MTVGGVAEISKERKNDESIADVTAEDDVENADVTGTDDVEGVDVDMVDPSDEVVSDAVTNDICSASLATRIHRVIEINILPQLHKCLTREVCF